MTIKTISHHTTSGGGHMKAAGRRVSHQENASVIPDGWAKYRLAEVVQSDRKICYGIVQPGAFDPTGVMLVRGRDYSSGWATPEEFFRVTPEIDRPYRRSKLKGGDLLLTIVGAGTGNVATVPAWLEGANITQTTARIAVDQARFDPHFVRALLESSLGQLAVHRALKGGAQPGLNIADVERFEFAFPQLPIQRRIAEILATWDQAIETLKALIGNARERRDGLLNDLLENPDWPRRHLGSLGELASAGVDKKSREDERPVRLLNFVDVLRRDFIDDRSLSHWVTAPERQIAKCDVRRGDIFFTPSSETRDDIAHSAVATEDIPHAAYSYHVVRFRLAEPWPLDFRAYAFKSQSFLKQAQALCAGSGQRYVLSQNQFASIVIHVPPLDAQERIGGLLRTIDREHESLGIQLAALRQEKAALMQQLLTGKRRVKLAASEAA